MNERGTAHNLTRQVLQQTSLRIYDQLRDRLKTATTHVELFRRLIESGRVKADNFPGLASIWVGEMESKVAMSRYSIALAKTGEWLYVLRNADDKVIVSELRPSPAGKKLLLKSFQRAILLWRLTLLHSETPLYLQSYEYHQNKIRPYRLVKTPCLFLLSYVDRACRHLKSIPPVQQ